MWQRRSGAEVKHLASLVKKTCFTEPSTNNGAEIRTDTHFKYLGASHAAVHGLSALIPAFKDDDDLNTLDGGFTTFLESGALARELSDKRVESMPAED